MRRQPRRVKRLASLLAIGAAVLLAQAAGDGSIARAHALSGAIWTSFAHGTETNGNVYPSPGPGASFTVCNAQLDDVGLPTTNNAKDCVFLNGGPNGPGAAGLEPSSTAGPYYVFQVTDPSGAVLLSNDPAECRRFTVGSDGRIDGVVNTGGCEHRTGHDHEQSHDGSDVMTIQLNCRVAGPSGQQCNKFDDTPNPGGEYKVWITRKSDFDALAPDPDGTGPLTAQTCDPSAGSAAAKTACKAANLAGFVGGHIKTDNFKVLQGQLVQLGTISGVKYYDCSAFSGSPPAPPGTCNNGSLDVSVEVGIPNWPIKVCRLTGGNGPPGAIGVGDCVVTLTSALGAYGVVGLGNGDYCIREARSRDVDTDPANAAFNTFDWKQTQTTSPASSVTFGATTNGTAAAGCNASGTFDPDLMNGVYSPVMISNGSSVTDRNFGNVARQLVVRTDGLTWGYWKTHTGTPETDPKAPQDSTYTSAPFTTTGIDIGSSSGTHLHVDTASEADIVFAADGGGSDPVGGAAGITDLCSVANDCQFATFVPPADCSGPCHEQLAAQLLALELNCLKFSNFCSGLYLNPGDPLSGMTVGAVVALADAALTSYFDTGSCASGGYSCNQIHAAVDAINNNASSGVVFSLVLLPAPPTPLCFVGFSGVPDALGTAFTCP